ncbi:hypothetical protein D3C76_1767780 [compost metagenome]
MLRIRQDQPGDRVSQQLDDMLFFALPTVVIVHYQRLVALFQSDGFDTGQQIGENLVVERGDQNANARLLR